jgi:hypothetical protein
MIHEGKIYDRALIFYLFFLFLVFLFSRLSWWSELRDIVIDRDLVNGEIWMEWRQGGFSRLFSLYYN